jgi:hypothetical protein
MRTMPNLRTFLSSEPGFTTREQDKSYVSLLLLCFKLIPLCLLSSN